MQTSHLVLLLGTLLLCVTTLASPQRECRPLGRLPGSVPPECAPPKQTRVEPSRLVALAARRMERGQHEVRVFRGKQALEPPAFLELLVARPVDASANLSALRGEKVALVRSLKNREQWEVHSSVGWDVLDLPANIFVVKEAVAGSGKQPLEVRVNGEVYRLQKGEISSFWAERTGGSQSSQFDLL